MNGTATLYPNIRANIRGDLVYLSDEQIDAVVAEIYGAGVAAEDVEGFFDNLSRGFQTVGHAVGNFAQQAAPMVAKALPSIAQGAMTGAKFGPWGALAGAVAGGAGGILSQSKDPTLRRIGGGIGSVTQLASNFTGGGAFGNIAKIGLGALGGGGGRGGGGGIGGLLGQAGQFAPQLAGILGGGGRGGGGRGGAGAAGLLSQFAGAAGGGGGIGGILGGLAPQLAAMAGSIGQGHAAPGGSANSLLGMLARPETTQALMAAAMGALGRPAVPVGPSAVPVQSILSALSRLAGNAAHEMEAANGEAAHPEFYYGAEGELALDPADSDQTTNALLALYALSLPRWGSGPGGLQAEPPESADEWVPQYTAADAAADAWLLENANWAEAEEGESYA